jgi:hypothetical protein
MSPNTPPKGLHPVPIPHQCTGACPLGSILTRSTNQNACSANHMEQIMSAVLMQDWRAGHGHLTLLCLPGPSFGQPLLVERGGMRHPPGHPVHGVGFTTKDMGTWG